MQQLNNLLFKLNNDITEKGKRGKHDFFGFVVVNDV